MYIIHFEKQNDDFFEVAASGNYLKTTTTTKNEITEKIQEDEINTNKNNKDHEIKGGKKVENGYFSIKEAKVMVKNNCDGDLNIIYLNIRSIKQKMDEFELKIREMKKRPQIIIIGETWIKKGEEKILPIKWL